MWLLQQADAVAALPEVALALLAMVLLMFGVFRKGEDTEPVIIAALVALGVAADTPVGILLDRSFDLVIAMLAALKVGHEAP